MKQIELYTFKAEPNLLVRIAGRKEKGFRFDEKGMLEIVDDGQHRFIERIKRKFEYTCEKFDLIKPHKAYTKTALNGVVKEFNELQAKLKKEKKEAEKLENKGEKSPDTSKGGE